MLLRVKVEWVAAVFWFVFWHLFSGVFWDDEHDGYTYQRLESTGWTCTLVPYLYL